MKRNGFALLGCFLLITFLLPAQIQLGPNITGLATDNELGSSVALSSSGNRVAVASSVFDGPNGSSAGQVRIYEINFSLGSWVQMGNAIDGEAAFDFSGTALSMSGDGTRVAIGAPNHDGGGIQAGQVRVFEWDGTAWNQLGSDLDGEDLFNSFGSSVALSSDGNRLAVGGPENSDGGMDAGHVRVFEWQVSNWVQLGSDIDGDNAFDFLGESLSLSEDGSRVAIGTSQSETNGYVQVFEFQAGTWIKVGSDIIGGIGDQIGVDVSLSADGSILAVGALADDVRVYELIAGSWVPLGVGIPRVFPGDNFGRSLALSADGQRIAIGGPFDDQGSTNLAANFGVVRVYDFLLGSWLQLGVDVAGFNMGDNFGASVALSANGDRFAAGVPLSDTSFSNAGLVQVYNNLNIVLPLALVDFEADLEPEAIRLSARLSLGYLPEDLQIQHSADGLNWQILISGPVHNWLDTVSSSITFLHSNPSPGFNFYRLWGPENESSWALSPVVSAYWEQEQHPVAYPNPTLDILYLDEVWEGEIEFWDAQGILLARFTGATHSLDLQTIPSGVYYLLLKSPERTRRIRIVKE